jgi:flagellar biosynthesis anti-sigma factor FlgM
MNIRNGIENLSQILPSQTAATSTAAKSGGSAVGESLAGDEAKLSVAATQAAQSSSDSDVRLDKVASIQSALQAGTYNVPAGDVAQKLISSLLVVAQ